MKRLASIVLSAALGATSLVACTPRPNDPEPVATAVLEALAADKPEDAGQYIDQSEAAEDIIRRSFDGLQAEGLETNLTDIDVRENVATAHYHLRWILPRERELSYDTEMLLTLSDGEWTVRWRPSMIHPQLAAHQHLELRSVAAEPASVITSDGASVLVPGRQHRVVVDTDQLATDEQRRSVAYTISRTLDAIHREDAHQPTVSAEELKGELAKHTGSYSVALVADRFGAQLRTAVSAQPAVRINEEAAMINKDPEFAPDIMARVNRIVADDVQGNNGWKVSTVSAEGAAYTDVDYHAPQPAPAIRVSLDHKVQNAAQAAVNTRSSMEAMMVVIRPSTGEILAVAQTPEADKHGDLALMGQYPPGSVFKIITASAGIEHQGLGPGASVPCPSTMDIGTRVVTNYAGFGLGTVPLQTAFARSCNTTFADISSRLAPSELQEEGRKFGIGVDYEIPGLDTLTGSIPKGEDELARTDAGYGQGDDLVSPFGVALVAATAAAGHTPTPVLIQGHQTEVKNGADAPSQHVIDGLRPLMRAVVTHGTATGMKAGGEIYAKTGEAEFDGGSHAWFAGYRDDLAFATLVVRGGGSESSVAVTDEFFRLLDAPAE
ncbi:penicillin-binding transpeptidase domain-containing protein [Corynebacterium uropygiale]|uniref:Penicillin-binding transpeptidase domain-containing protein n=1 Tax=Corynebacterium uropygiale TaxID=1775911 RepID=A0A9X1QN85_9CORY|nr:penicillin-binding transpeptidase domain-containing protein [Corynebacterium uropygiale]MCF4006399.1 penicillin-binding transpeptidase domain-containing protein [Corynebacterium uropygiale]